MHWIGHLAVSLAPDSGGGSAPSSSQSPTGPQSWTEDDLVPRHLFLATSQRGSWFVSEPGKRGRDSESKTEGTVVCDLIQT